MRKSLLRRLILSFGLSFFILILLSNGILYYLLVRGLETERDAILVDKLDAISTLLRTPDRGLEELHHRVEEDWPKRGGERLFISVRDGNGDLVARTPGLALPLAELLKRLPPGVEGGRSRSLVRFDGPGGESYVGSARTQGNLLGLVDPVVIGAAVGEEQSQEFLARFREVAVAVTSFSVLLAVAFAVEAARQAMQPLKAIADKVRGIGSETLHERVAVEGLPVELHPLGQAFNQTLDRLEDAFARISRFSADIAHELRTPIFNMMGEIEVMLARPRDASEYQEALSSAHEECGKLTRLIESLLFLARAENGGETIDRKVVKLGPELEGMLEFLEPSASERGVELRLEQEEGADSGLSILAEPVLFQRVIGNLVSNAIRYTQFGGRIVVGYGPGRGASGMARIFVRDSGSGIAPEHLSRIFERFYRVDPSRTPGSGGSGLGLAIVKSIVELHRGRVSVRSEPGQGTEIGLEWPKAKA